LAGIFGDNKMKIKMQTSEELLKEMLTDDPDFQIGYLKASFEDNYDMPGTIMKAIRAVAEVRGISNLAENADLNRENLYRVLSGNTFPRIDTFFKIIDALGLRLTVEPKVS
jgi:probable addiction module antidote protein